MGSYSNLQFAIATADSQPSYRAPRERKGTYMREITLKNHFFSNLKNHLLPNTGSDLNFIPFVQFFNI